MQLELHGTCNKNWENIKTYLRHDEGKAEGNER